MYHELVSQNPENNLPLLRFYSKQSIGSALMSIFLAEFWKMFLVVYLVMSRYQLFLVCSLVTIVSPGGICWIRPWLDWCQVWVGGYCSVEGRCNIIAQQDIALASEQWYGLHVPPTFFISHLPVAVNQLTLDTFERLVFELAHHLHLCSAVCFAILVCHHEPLII